MYLHFLFQRSGLHICNPHKKTIKKIKNKKIKQDNMWGKKLSWSRLFRWLLVSSVRQMSRNGGKGNGFCCVVSFISSSLGFIYGIQSAKCGLLIDRTSSLYLKVRLKAVASAIILSLTGLYILCLIGLCTRCLIGV